MLMHVLKYITNEKHETFFFFIIWNIRVDILYRIFFWWDFRIGSFFFAWLHSCFMLTKWWNLVLSANTCTVLSLCLDMYLPSHILLYIIKTFCLWAVWILNHKHPSQSHPVSFLSIFLFCLNATQLPTNH